MAKRKTAYETAYEKGKDARKNGRPIEDCPYKDKRKDDGRLTWSRAFIRAWMEGWHDQDRAS